MKKVAWGTVFVFALLLLVVPPSDAWVRSHVFIGVGPVWWGPPWWYYPPPYYYYPPAYVYTPPPVIVQQQPPVYVQQQPAPPAAPPAPPSESYWYYCPGSKAYYPHVQTCAEGWVKVPPRR